MKKIVGMCHIRGTMCQRLQKSAKADILFRMLLVKQHSKIGICFVSATRGNLFMSNFFRSCNVSLRAFQVKLTHNYSVPS